MSRRTSVSLHDIVFSDFQANQYYNSRKTRNEIHSDESEAMRVKGPSSIKKINLADLPVAIECDPVALADYLLLKEEEEIDDIEDFCPNLPNASMLQISDSKATTTSPSMPVPKTAKPSASKISDDRKQSALVEHERIRQALKECGFLLEF